MTEAIDPQEVLEGLVLEMGRDGASAQDIGAAIPAVLKAVKFSNAVLDEERCKKAVAA